MKVGNWNRLLRVGMFLMEENCALILMMTLASMSLSLRKPQWAFHHLHNQPPLKLRFTGLPTCPIDPGAAGACPLSGGMRLTMVCPLIPEKFHCLSRIIATYETLGTNMS